MVLVADVDPVDLDDAVALPHAGRLRRAARVHLADELPRPRFLGVQVEAVPVERGGLLVEDGKFTINSQGSDLLPAKETTQVYE